MIGGSGQDIPAALGSISGNCKCDTVALAWGRRIGLPGAGGLSRLLVLALLG